MKANSIALIGSVTLVCGVLFIAIGVLVGMPSFFGISPPNPMVNYLSLSGIVALVVGIILIAHGIAVKHAERDLAHT